MDAFIAFVMAAFVAGTTVTLHNELLHRISAKPAIGRAA